MRNNTVTSKYETFYQLKGHMVSTSKEVYGESGDMVVVQEVEERCKNFDTIATPSITITLKSDLVSRYISLSLSQTGLHVPKSCPQLGVYVPSWIRGKG